MSLIIDFLDDQTKNSIKTAIGFSKFFFRFLLIWIWIPLILGVLLAFWYRNKEKEKPLIYRAGYVFIQSSQIESSQVSIPSVEIPFGTAGSGQTDQQEIMGSILRSDEVMGRALFSPVSIENGELLINFFAREYFPDNQSSINFTVTSIDSLSITQKSMFKGIVSYILNPENGILSFSNEGVTRLNIGTTNPELSLALAKNLYSSFQEFYDGNSNKSFSRQLRKRIIKRDSILALKNYYQQALLKEEETDGFIKIPTDRDRSINNQEQLSILTQEYLIYRNQVEQFKISKNDETYFRTLNFPIEPLAAPGKQIRRQTIMGGIIGFAMGIVLIVMLFVAVQLFQLIRSL